jgi:hypothetical protein
MKFYAVIGEHALEFRSVVAEKRFYEQRGKPVIIDIDGHHQPQQNRQRALNTPPQHRPAPKRKERPASKGRVHKGKTRS